MIDLMRLTLTDPAAAWRRLNALNPPTAERVGMIVAAAFGGAALSGVGVRLLPAADAATDPLLGLAHAPLMLAVVQMLSGFFAALLLSEGGRVFGGAGRYRDALLAVGWVELLLVFLQALQLLVMVILPPAGGLVALAVVCVAIYVSVRFTMLVHGFKNPLLVVLGMVATVLLAGLALSMLARLVVGG